MTLPLKGVSIEQSARSASHSRSTATRIVAVASYLPILYVSFYNFTPIIIAKASRISTLSSSLHVGVVASSRSLSSQSPSSRGSQPKPSAPKPSGPEPFLLLSTTLRSGARSVAAIVRCFLRILMPRCSCDVCWRSLMVHGVTFDGLPVSSLVSI